jgi:hypothetical protein
MESQALLLPENCMEYMIFIVDQRLEAQNVLPALEKVRKSAMQLSESLTSEYIWQRDSFNLELKTQRGLRLVLMPRTCFHVIH